MANAMIDVINEHIRVHGIDDPALENITERIDPTTSASGVVIKFDGIGNSEDLVLSIALFRTAKSYS